MKLYEICFMEQEKYSKIYGPKTIVFMQVGKFYEAYSTKTKGYVNIGELEPLLNIKFIRRLDDHGKLISNKLSKQKQLSYNQFGIPCVSISRNVATLVENGYTIVLFDQKESTNNNEEDLENEGRQEMKERECVGVFSPGTYISDKPMDANYIMVAYIKEEKQLRGEKTLLAVGISIIDVSTGYNFVHEFYSDKYDEVFGMDELLRMMQIFRPTESVIYFHPIVADDNIINGIKQYLELKKYNSCYFFTYNQKGSDNLNLLVPEMFKINYQNDYLSKIFSLGSQLTLNKKQSAIELFELEMKPYSLISYLIMLRYIEEHDTKLLKNLCWPSIYIYNKHLILGNNAVEQLNIIDSNNLEIYNEKIKSLFDVVNKTSTPMGKRFLKEALLNPYSQENKIMIKQRYDLIAELLCDNFYKKLQQELKHIYDMERLHRRMAMGIIMPFQFYRLDTFYQATTKVLGMISNNNILKKIIDDKTIKEFMTFQTKYNKEFDFDKLQNYSNFSEIDQSFFKKGIHQKLDEIQDKIDYVWSLINSINSYFTQLISSRCKKINDKELISTESNMVDGYYFTIAKSRASVLKEELKKQKEKIRIDLGIGETFEINKNDIVFKPLQKGRTKIFVTALVEHTLNLTKDTTRLTKMIRKLFVKSMLNYYSDNRNMLLKINKFVAELDFLISGATVASQNYYCKPEIPSKENIGSYFRAKKLRHAIVEKLCNETEFIPNDIELGNVPEDNHDGKNSINDKSVIEKPQEKNQKKNGMVLYGINSSGKSSCMKSIGIAIILAQIGYYVPAEEFVYEPYMTLYARITGNDNIFKGLSSFALEMTELDAILLRTERQGQNTLVIGDEICRGTEGISGISIVSSALVTLSECNCTFIFSSHLHDIPNIDEVKKLNNIHFYHLRVEYDEANDCLIFDRKLVPGPGPAVYGLMVAKYLIKNEKFINRAERIKKRIMNEEKIDIPIKKSNYNHDLLVKNCAICGYQPSKNYHKELESHHIHFQKDCLSNGKIKEKPYLHKNMLCNLVVLCRKCHVKVHQGEIIINGYSDTSMGPMLDYKVDSQKRLENGIAAFEKLGRRLNFGKINNNNLNK